MLKVLFIAFLFGILFQHKDFFVRIYNLATLLDKNKIAHNFRNMDKVGLPYNRAFSGNSIANFVVDTNHTLPTYFSYDNTTLNLTKWLENHWTTGIVVLKVNNATNARLLYEKYYLGNDESSKVISWSTGKSIVSVLVGLAIQDGYIKSVDDLITTYVPLISKSGYNNIKIKDVLQMSSGIHFDENYFDFWSDINGLIRNIALGFSLEDYVNELHQENSPGIKHNYVSIDTQILGMVLKNAINKSLTEYLEEKLWIKGGFECDLFWLKEINDNRELAFGTINTCTRDYARFGWFFLNKGKSPLDGTQLINEKWIEDSITPDAPHVMPGVNKQFPLGYGYQWWIPGCEHNISQICDDYLAIGVYNQFIYVSPKYNIVIAKNSAYADYEKDPEDSELGTIAMFREIAKEFSKY